MTQNDLGNKSADTNYRDIREHRRELRRELRGLRDYYPGHGLFAGLLLVIIGGLFLADNIIGFSIGQWWPLILVLVGVAVLVRALVYRD